MKSSDPNSTMIVGMKPAKEIGRKQGQLRIWGEICWDIKIKCLHSRYKSELRVKYNLAVFRILTHTCWTLLLQGLFLAKNLCIHMTLLYGKQCLIMQAVVTINQVPRVRRFFGGCCHPHQYHLLRALLKTSSGSVFVLFWCYWLVAEADAFSETV